MRLVIERIVGELDHYRIPSRGYDVVHPLQYHAAVVSLVIHVVHHIVIPVHLRTCRKLGIVIRGMVLEQLGIVTAHKIIADILKLTDFFPLGRLEHRVSPGHIQIIIISLAHNQIPRMVLAAAGDPGHVGTEHPQPLQKILSRLGISGTDRTPMDKHAVNILIIRRLQIIVDGIYYIFIHIQNLVILRILCRDA